MKTTITTGLKVALVAILAVGVSINATGKRKINKRISRI